MTPTRRRLDRQRRAAAVTLSVAAHGLAVLVAVGLYTGAPPPPEAPPVQVQLITLTPEPPPVPAPKPEPKQAPAAPAKTPKPQPKKEEPPPKRTPAREAKAAPPNVPVIAAGESSDDDGRGEVSDAELVGATMAGAGGSGSGGGCDMPAMVQKALRRDRQAREAVHDAHRGRALQVWNGDWVRHRGQDGAGLAAVREAITWEVAWAPEACRKQVVSGPVVLSLNDGPGSPRVVLGGGRWRWSDLLFARGAVRR
jgi:hypothetical protein